MSQTNPLCLETPRSLDEVYQRDHAEYARRIQQLQAVLLETEAKAKQFKPYRLDHPLRRPLPAFEQRVKVLRTWSGEYPNLNRQSEGRIGG
jgi:hypothetical protein